jgi:hypothetical protein
MITSVSGFNPEAVPPNGQTPGHSTYSTEVGFGHASTSPYRRAFMRITRVSAVSALLLLFVVLAIRGQQHGSVASERWQNSVAIYEVTQRQEMEQDLSKFGRDGWQVVAVATPQPAQNVRPYVMVFLKKRL